MRTAYQVFGLDSHTLSVDGSEVRVLEEGDEVRLRGLLEGHDRRGLEAEVRLCSKTPSQLPVRA